jgi:alkaline phosphatase D
MSGSRTRWNLLANQTQWSANDRTWGPGQTYEFDGWDGYRAQRRRLLEFFGTGAAANPVVLTGDRHATFVSDLRTDFDDPRSPVVGAELVGSSLTSAGDPDTAAFHANYDPLMAESPHWRYIDNRRGYVVCDLTAQSLTAALRVVDAVSVRTSAISTAARFRVQAGVAGIAAVEPGHQP